jgi:ABC-2 type transport system ATP-binding protein
MIRTENLSKYYNDVCAVSDVSLNISRSEIYGFLGLNGAGKTTTIRILLGMIRPGSGSAWINGRKVSSFSTELWKKVGALVEMPYSYPELTVRENLEMFRRLHSIADPGSVDRIMERLQLSSYAKRKVRNLSLGNNQRLGLAKALIHEPEILILDEPTNGLDPAGIHEIRELLLDLSENRGVTIFISSHILAEISRFATRIGIIHQGMLIKELDSVHLEALSRNKLEINTMDNSRAAQILEKKGYLVRSAENGHIELLDEHAISDPATVAAFLVNEGCPPTLLKPGEEDLEAFFLRTISMKGGQK